MDNHFWGGKLLAGRKELVARVAELSESIATTGWTEPNAFVMESDLTLSQIRVLYVLASGPARISDVARAHGMARPNASNMVERLVRKGLVERVSDPSDRRVALACLTEKGREAIGTVSHSNYEAMEAIATVLSIDELELVAGALEILERGVRRLEAASEDSTGDASTGTTGGDRVGRGHGASERHND